MKLQKTKVERPKRKRKKIRKTKKKNTRLRKSIRIKALKWKMELLF